MRFLLHLMSDHHIAIIKASVTVVSIFVQNFI